MHLALHHRHLALFNEIRWGTTDDRVHGQSPQMRGRRDLMCVDVCLLQVLGQGCSADESGVAEVQRDGELRQRPTANDVVDGEERVG